MSVPSYILCGTPRSGSTLLCDLLASSGVAGRPNSFYRRESIEDFARMFGVPTNEGIEGLAFDRAYYEAVVREGKAGTPVFGMRLMWPSVSEASRRLDRVLPGMTNDAARFNRAFGYPRYFFLTRDDKVAQAVSRLKAEQSGLWHLAADGSERERSAPHRPPTYDGDQLERYLREALDHEAKWARWFDAEGIEPIVVNYETMAADPRATVAEALSALGQDPSEASRAEIRTSRMADAKSLAWAARYRAEERTGSKREGQK